MPSVPALPPRLRAALVHASTRAKRRSAALAGALAVLLWLPGWSELSIARAQTSASHVGELEPTQGAQFGASRQAWAAAAALSRGIGLVADRDALLLATGGSAPASMLAGASPLSAIGPGRFRTVRLLVPLSSVRGPHGDLTSLDRTIDAFIAQGLHVVLSLHDEEVNASPPRERAESAKVARAWQLLGRRYADRPHQLLFELSFAPGASSAQKNAHLPTLRRAMRERNPTRVLVVRWDDAVGLPQLRLPRDRHLIVGILHSEPWRFTRQGHGATLHSDRWNGTTCCSGAELQLMTLPLNLAKAWSEEQRIPVWVAGFVSHHGIASGLRARHARLVRNAAEERGLPWAYGDWDPQFGIGDGIARAWDKEMVEALTGR